MKRILACTDLSESGRRALDRAVRLAMGTGARLDVIHAASGDTVDGARLHSRLLQEAQLAAVRAGAGSIEIRSLVSVLRPEDAILQRARQTNPDLIVLGGHGEPRFRDAVFGTTATHVVRHSHVPVLIVQSQATSPYARLMVAAEAAGAAPRLVENALAIAPAAEVFTVHAFHAGFLDSLGGEEVLEDLAARQVHDLQSALAQVTAARPEALLAAHRHIVVEPGDALTVLMDEVDQLVPDLVVMGVRDRGTYAGSRAVDAFFWCPTDLLIVPGPESAAEGKPSLGSTVSA